VNQRNICWNHQGAVCSTLSANRCCHFDGAGLSGVVVRHDLKIETRSQLAARRLFWRSTIVGVGVLPEREEILVGGFRFGGVAGEGIVA